MNFWIDILSNHRSMEDSRSNCYNSNSESTQISGHWSCKSINRSFWSRICNLASLAFKTSNTWHINNHSSFTLFSKRLIFAHMKSCVSRCIDRSIHIDINRFSKQIKVHNSFWADGQTCSCNTCTINEYVECSESFYRSLYRFFYS